MAMTLAKFTTRFRAPLAAAAAALVLAACAGGTTYVAPLQALGARHGHDATAGSEVAQRDRAIVARSARKLAELYWEMNYRGLAVGELRNHAIDRALGYAHEALRADPTDADLMLRVGRLLHAQHRSGDAHKAYVEAQGLGLHATRVLPYLAELAFDVRDYDELRRLLAALRDWPGMSRLQPVIHYWVKT